MSYTIKIITPHTEKSCVADADTNIMNLLIGQGITIDAPCAGCKTCGKCKITIDPAPAITPEQSEFISKDLVDAGVRLACHTQVACDCTITVDSACGAAIVSSGIIRDYTAAPRVSKKFISLTPAAIDDQRSHDLRLADAIGCDIADISIDIHMIKKLEAVLSDTHQITVTLCGGNTSVLPAFNIVDIQPGDTASSCFGIAVDIGTTTVVAYMYDLTNGKCLDICSELNDQRSFGADVISRIDYACQNTGNLQTLQTRIASQITRMANTLAARNSIDNRHIYYMTITANTTMLHLLCGVSPKGIAASPFTPVFTSGFEVSAGQIGIDINHHLTAYIIPGVSGYVGADTVAAMLSCSMDTPKKALLIDIGTNGEIVLVNQQSITSCSTAAGPAFEGAHIRHGMGGVEGAIDNIGWDGEHITFTTIGNMPPIGICGSAIVDCLAMLLDLGVVDETGRLVDSDEIEHPFFSSRIIDIDGQNAFVIYGDIVLTAKDVREIQLAKAAIAAGMHTLLDSVGIKPQELDVLYLAGGFGSYVRRESAIRIGLLPCECAEKIVVCGNAAGSGASAVLCCEPLVDVLDSLQKRCGYIELSTSVAFQDWYMECMMF